MEKRGRVLNQKAQMSPHWKAIAEILLAIILIVWLVLFVLRIVKNAAG